MGDALSIWMPGANMTPEGEGRRSGASPPSRQCMWSWKRPGAQEEGVLTVAWDLTAVPEFQAELDWIDAFVREEVEPIDALLPPRHLPTRMMAAQEKFADVLEQHVANLETTKGT